MYLWIVIIGGAFSFFASMGIGANDAANAFATSIGSKALNMKQVIVLAAIFETLGAVLMGGHVTDTIRKGIADYKCFENQPELLMYGCMWVVLSVGLWLFLASKYEMPVSTTHSCVGGMIGMTIALAGPDCVIWYTPVETFPYVGGVSGIVMSWFLSPLFSSILAAILFGTMRETVLRKDFNSYRMNYAYSILIGSTMTINAFFIIYKGAKGLGLHNTQLEIALPVALGIGITSSLITLPLVPKLKKYVESKLFIKNCENDNENDNNNDKNNIELKASGEDTIISDEILNYEIIKNQNTLNIKSTRELSRIVDLHNNAEKFNEKTEEVFKYLQVFTAICDAFSHGANDVANAIGPFAVIYTIYQSNGELTKKTSMGDNAYWILGIGGIGIAVGLFVYGYKITHAIGEKLCKITPSRGVAIELSSALVIIAGSRLKMPLSTTHCQVGATVGIGLLENPKKCSGINCNIFGKTVFGWLLTCVVVGTTAGILTAQGTYSPAIKGWGYTNSTLV